VSAPLHVLQFGSGNALYGAERWILALIRYLDPARVRTTVMTVKDAPDCPTALVDEARARGFAAQVLEAPGRLSPAGVRALGDFCRAEGVDIVHAHGYKPDVYALLARRRGGHRLLITPHGWSHTRTPAEVLYEGVDRLSFSFADAVAPLSEDLMRFRVLPGVRGPLVRLITNGVDTDEIGEAPPADRPGEVPEGAFVIGYVGQLIARKGVDRLIDALAALKADGWHGLIVGDGPERPALEARAREKGIADRVSFTGFREDRLGLVKGMGLFVLPSYLEGIPRCLMEAMTASVPAVATDIPGVTDLVTDGETGWLFPPGDTAALTALLEAAVAGRLDLGGVAKKGRERVMARFSARRMAGEYEALFRDVMERGR
jgi:glycosyltransferase involved in cell wall biosynthesis